MRRRKLVLLISAGCILYFGYHALKGRHGLEARAQLAAEAEMLDRQRTVLEAARARLKRDIALLDDAALDPDLLDETARAMLGYAREGDIVILAAPAAR